MENAFYKLIKDEEAIRLANSAVSDDFLKQRAECTRFQFYFRIFQSELTFRSFVVVAVWFWIGHFFEDSFLVAMLLALLVLEVNWRLVKRDAVKQLYRRETEREKKSEESKQDNVSQIRTSS